MTHRSITTTIIKFVLVASTEYLDDNFRFGTSIKFEKYNTVCI